jgi:hypothetical protein
VAIRMTEQSSPALSQEEVGRIFGVLLAELRTLSLTNARSAVASAGITGVNVSSQYWDPFLAGVERAFGELSGEGQFAAIRILADGFASSSQVRDLLAKHGYQYVDGTFVPIGLIDQREALYLPPSSAGELAKAMKRLIDGDDTGAITAACGAVDTLMQEIYSAQGLGDPGKVAFAAKVNTAIQELGIFQSLEVDLTTLGMKKDDAVALVADLRKATNHAAQMLQTMRRTMGDVHGSKPAFRRAAYDSIKWASAICGLFGEQAS